MIDHTLLKADATVGDMERLCMEAIQHDFYAVCVNPRWLPLVSKILKHESPQPITVVGFPLGANLSKTKAQETELCLKEGAREIDMVIDLGALKSGLWDDVKADIRSVYSVTGRVPLKVIIESAALTENEILRATEACLEAGVAFVKTSTGFHANGGASTKAIQLMASVAKGKMGIKASGGIKTLTQVEELIRAGATRVGSSNSVKILEEASGVLK